MYWFEVTAYRDSVVLQLRHGGAGAAAGMEIASDLASRGVPHSNEGSGFIVIDAAGTGIAMTALEQTLQQFVQRYRVTQIKINTPAGGISLIAKDSYATVDDVQRTVESIVELQDMSRSSSCHRPECELRLMVDGDRILLGSASFEAISKVSSELTQHGVPHDRMTLRQAGAGSWADVMMAAVGAGGALTVLAQTLRRFVERHRVSEITIETPDGTKVTTKDASIDDVQRTIALVMELQAAQTPIV